MLERFKKAGKRLKDSLIDPVVYDNDSMSTSVGPGAPLEEEPAPRSAVEVGASRAEFSGQIRRFIEMSDHEHALELLKSAIAAEEGKPQTYETRDELRFLREMQQGTIELIKKRQEGQ